MGRALDSATSTRLYYRQMASDSVMAIRSREVLAANGMSSGDSGEHPRMEPRKNFGTTGQTPLKPCLPLQGPSSGVNQL